MTAPWRCGVLRNSLASTSIRRMDGTTIPPAAKQLCCLHDPLHMCSLWQQRVPDVLPGPLFQIPGQDLIDSWYGSTHQPSIPVLMYGLIGGASEPGNRSSYSGMHHADHLRFHDAPKVPYMLLLEKLYCCPFLIPEKHAEAVRGIYSVFRPSQPPVCSYSFFTGLSQPIVNSR